MIGEIKVKAGLRFDGRSLGLIRRRNRMTRRSSPYSRSNRPPRNDARPVGQCASLSRIVCNTVWIDAGEPGMRQRHEQSLFESWSGSVTLKATNIQMAFFDNKGDLEISQYYSMTMTDI